MSDVIICSHYEASVLVKTKPNFYDVVYIGDPEKPFYNAYSKEIIKKAKKINFMLIILKGQPNSNFL